MFTKENLPSALGLVVALAGAGAVWLFTSGPSSEVFSARGSTWYLTEAEWINQEGKWRVSGVVQPKKIKSDIDASLLSLTHSMCDAILTDMVAAPDGAERDDVFRVSLRVGGKGGALLADFAIPTPVMDGECALSVGDIIHPSYPGILGNWAFHGVDETADNTGNNEAVTLLFKPMVLAGDVPVRPRQLTDFQLACRMAIADVRNGDAFDAELISEAIEKAGSQVVVKVVEPGANAEGSERSETSDWMQVTGIGGCALAEGGGS